MDRQVLQNSVVHKQVMGMFAGMLVDKFVVDMVRNWGDKLVTDMVRNWGDKLVVDK